MTLKTLIKRCISYRVTEDADFDYNIASFAENTHYGDIGYLSQGKWSIVTTTSFQSQQQTKA